MTKITLTDLVDLQNENTAVNAINNNNAVLEAAIDNTLSRDGESPNQMDAVLDMNSNPIINLPSPVTSSEPIRLADMTQYVQFQNSINLAAAVASASANAASASTSASTATGAAASATSTAAAVATTVGTYGIDSYASAAAGTVIPPAVHTVQLYGRNAANDGGAVIAIDRGLTNPGGPSRSQWQAPDGRYFQYKTSFVTPEMFGEFGGSSVVGPDNSVGLTQMFNYVNFFFTPKIILTSGLYCLDNKLPTLNCLVEIDCRLGGAQPPIFIKRYVDGTFDGVIRTENFGIRAKGLQILATAGSGGSGISCKITNAQANAGEIYLEKCHISMGDFAFLSMYMDGDSNQVPAGPGLRSIYIKDTNFFGALNGCVYMTGCHHTFLSNCMFQTAGGSSSTAFVYTAASSSFKADNLNIAATTLAGNVTLTNLTRGNLQFSLASNFVADSSVDGVQVYANPGGTVTLGWTNSHLVSS